MVSEAPDEPRFFVLRQEVGGRHDAHCHAIEPVRGEAPRCPRCGNFLGMLTWLPPYRVELELHGEALGDFIAAPGNGLLISERFAEAFRQEALTGLSGFHSVEVVRVRGRRRGPKPSSVPSYLFVNPAFGSAAVDEARSHIQHQRPISCDGCREAGVRAIRGFRLEQGSWTGALTRAVVAVETVATSPQGPPAVVMLKKGQGSRAGEAPGGRSSETVLRHRGGNRQVELSDGQRWHLPRGKSVADIPAEDKVGDMLQEAVTRAAKAWGPDKRSGREAAAIARAQKGGEYWLARLLEREARGRYVHARLKEQFDGLLRFNHQGADVIDPANGRKCGGPRPPSPRATRPDVAGPLW